MIKKLFILVFSVTLAASVFAQDTTDINDDIPEVSNVHYQPSRANKFHHYFVGGNLVAGFGDGGGAFGINPSIGYSVNQYVDVGIALNAVYNYQKYYNDDKQHTWNIGAAPFARIYPVPFLFFEASFEDNYVHSKYIPYGEQSYSDHWNVPSIIGSIGYAQRVYGQSYFFFSVGMDFLNNKNSPYREQYYDENNVLRSKVQPIVRTGFGVNLW
ncbi:hypothetical protein A9P82_09260 [Arachidicoccus ginsenosidimutans]|uniref:hypothetical protein n=1 Tax=Arachidicoccus sp. BS20 TaxID=1850526 RepID=UPI0007F05857|nr:hypothetical protein [Arachidicoccus sp. BS20]ANI89464.1 hypothetical protein A9P82_09260 [Arachidicoccus sp. BS20]